LETSWNGLGRAYLQDGIFEVENLVREFPQFVQELGWHDQDRRLLKTCQRAVIHNKACRDAGVVLLSEVTILKIPLRNWIHCVSAAVSLAATEGKPTNLLVALIVQLASSGEVLLSFLMVTAELLADNRDLGQGLLLEVEERLQQDHD
jgi:hypothetical protein